MPIDKQNFTKKENIDFSIIHEMNERSYPVGGASFMIELDSIFSIPQQMISLSTSDVNSITSTTAECGGIIESDGGIGITERGVCWSMMTSKPTIDDERTSDGTSIGSYISYLQNLMPETMYFVSSYAKNDSCVCYGDVKIFITSPSISIFTLTTSPISSVTSYSANCGGSIYTNGDEIAIEKGVCWSTIGIPTLSDSKTSDGNGNDSYSSSIYGLNENTNYYVRAYVITGTGTYYGETRTFTTLTSEP
jgi:hypothetical protein